jgi:RNA polymerase sigma factor (sigma-70 family)
MAAGMEELFRAHWPLVYGYLRRRTGDPALAEELAQETFYRATRAFLGWRGGSAAAWLLAIARNSLADEARRGRRLAPLPEDLVAEADPEQAIDLETALARLSPSHRRLLELVYFDGYSHAEVAAMTDTTPGAVKTAVWRARRSFESVYREKERHEGPHT